MDPLCTSVTTNHSSTCYGKQFAKQSGYIINWLFNSWVSVSRHHHRVAFFTKSYCQSLLLSWQPVWVLFPALSSCEGGWRDALGSDFGVWLPLETSRFDWSFFSVRAVPRESPRWNRRALLFASAAFVPQQEPRSRSDAYPWIHCFLFLCSVFLISHTLKAEILD